MPAPLGCHGDFQNLKVPIDHEAARIADEHARAFGNPPRAVALAEFRGDQAGVPRVGAHGDLLEGGHILGVGGVERPVRDALPVGLRGEFRLRVHRGAPLAAVGSDVLHACFQVLGVVSRELDALVFLRVRQARVHGQQQAGIVADDVEGVDVALLPCLPERQQKPASRDFPQRLVEDVRIRFVEVAVLDQAIANDELRGVVYFVMS